VEKPILPLESIFLDNDSMIPIDWDIKAVEDKRIRIIKPEKLEISDTIESDSSVSLEDCIVDFTKEEKLSKNDTWYCPNCKNHQQAMKKIDLWISPKYLILHLKRFGHGFLGGRKLDRHVTFPINGLDLSNFVKEYGYHQHPPIYDLYAVTNHYGSAFGGHYTAFCKNPDSGEWYLYDDKKVKKVKEENDIITKAAYLLYYKIVEN